MQKDTHDGSGFTPQSHQPNKSVTVRPVPKPKPKPLPIGARASQGSSSSSSAATTAWKRCRSEPSTGGSWYHSQWGTAAVGDGTSRERRDRTWNQTDSQRG